MSARGHLASRNDEEINRMMNGMKDRFQFDLDVIHEFARRNNGQIPQWLFESLPHVAPQSCIELVVLRFNPKNRDIVEILLIDRPDSDIYWPGQLHLPGTVNWIFDAEKGDRGEELWSRLEEETGLTDLSEETTTFITTHYTSHKKRERGPCQHVVMAVQIDEGFIPASGDWYNIGQLPEITIDHHVDIIAKILPVLDRVMHFPST